MGVVSVITLIVYDISNDQRRKRLSDYLKTKGLSRIQRSVFIGRLTSALIKDVERVVSRIIDEETDIVHIFPLTDYSLKYMKYYGKPFTDIKHELAVMVF